jgi:hypothetical protein
VKRVRGGVVKPWLPEFFPSAEVLGQPPRTDTFSNIMAVRHHFFLIHWLFLGFGDVASLRNQKTEESIQMQYEQILGMYK